ncbi:hypothetical protein ACI1TC_09200 [Lactococcus petauri]|uniref:hypothetical protein n=1 Tax=Lactococcus petauri TaxID=1940789 RepID=UPI003854DEA3
MKELIKKFFLLILITLLLFTNNNKVIANTIEAVSEPDTQVEFIGYIGSYYSILANNIVIHIKDLPKLDIWRDSKASVVLLDPTYVKLDKVTPVVSSSNIREKVGVYKARLSIKEDPKICKTINIYVVDDRVALGKEVLLYGHDFELTKIEKQNLTVEKEKIIAGVRAYDINSGTDITKEVNIKEGDLELYLQNDTKTISQNFYVRELDLEIKASTLLESNITSKVGDIQLKRGVRLPSTGEISNNLFAQGLLFIILLLQLIIFNSKLKNRKSKNSIYEKK